jgi:6-pyruvoyltetrahydropterin/6-carboxytetrahydropterin synthase
MRVFREFRFEAAHRLPDAPPGHKCRRLHGHSYRLLVYVDGPINPDTGWVIDFAEIRSIVDPVIDQLDHHYLNEIEGLSKPTAEVITRWIWDRIKPGLPGLCRIELFETAKCGCVYEGETRP